MNYNNSRQYFSPDNINYYFDVHKYCEIIDISVDSDEICIHYTFDGNFGTYNSNMKQINVMIINKNKGDWYIPDHFKYLSKIEVIKSDMDVISNGPSITIENVNIKETYLVFVNNHKDIDEKRDEKIETLLDNGES